MSAKWVAGCTRAKSLLNRRLGPAGARQIASSATLSEALLALAETAYGHDVRTQDNLVQAQHSVWATLLWHLRVTAGWQPRAGAAIVRTLAMGFAIANTESNFGFQLGALNTTDLLAATTSVSTRAALSKRLVWADRVVTGVPEAAAWAAGALAILVASEIFALERPLNGTELSQARRVLGNAAAATNFVKFTDQLPPLAKWALVDVEQPAELWRAEAAWWDRVERDGLVLLHGSRFDSAPLVGLIAVLAVDAWRVQAALEIAARGGKPLEAFDAIA